MEKNKNRNKRQNSLTDLASGVNSSPFGTPTINKHDSLQLNLRYYLITNDRQLLNHAYTEYGIIQTLVDQPVDDAFSKGYEIQSEQLSTDDLKELYSYIEMNNINDVICNTLKWGRLFGGSGLIINTGQKSDTALNLNQINENTPVEFIDADQWELNYNYQSNIDAPYYYYDMNLHKSRVLRYEGKKAPSLIRPRLRGWGMSVIERVIRSMNQYIKNNNVIYELLDEAKVDVYKISEFNNSLMTDGGTNAVTQRIQAANMIKNYVNALTMDIDDEYEQKNIAFSGLGDMLTQIRIGVAADLKMPMTKLFGLSASGFNAGEDDIENYNSMIESEIRSKSRFIVNQVVSILCKKLFGFIPDDIIIEFPSLRILTSEQEENVKNSQFNRVLSAFNSQLITEEQAIASINHDNLLGINIEEI